MSRTIIEAQYVCGLTKDDINLHMAELASAVDLVPLMGGGPDSYAQEALDNLQSLAVAVRVWAKAQQKIEAAARKSKPEVYVEAVDQAIDPTCIWSEAKAHTFPPVGGSGA